MLRDKGSRVLRTPPGYMRYHEDPDDLDKDGAGGLGKSQSIVLNNNQNKEIKKQSLEYINKKSVANEKPYLAKHLELKNRIDSIHLKGKDAIEARSHAHSESKRYQSNEITGGSAFLPGIIKPNNSFSKQ